METKKYKFLQYVYHLFAFTDICLSSDALFGRATQGSVPFFSHPNYHEKVFAQSSSASSKELALCSEIDYWTRSYKSKLLICTNWQRPSSSAHCSPWNYQLTDGADSFGWPGLETHITKNYHRPHLKQLVGLTILEAAEPHMVSDLVLRCPIQARQQCLQFHPSLFINYHLFEKGLLAQPELQKLVPAPRFTFEFHEQPLLIAKWTIYSPRCVLTTPITPGGNWTPSAAPIVCACLVLTH